LNLRALGFGITALIIVMTGAVWFLGANGPTAVSTKAPTTVASNGTGPPAEVGHLSIVVLPFANLSNDPSQDYFADGITETLTTDLSRSGSRRARARSIGRGCHAARSPPTQSAFSFMRSPTISNRALIAAGQHRNHKSGDRQFG
jgi:hypothetical protein